MSPRAKTNTNTFQSSISLLALIGRYVVQLLPIAAFLFTNTLSAEVLAATTASEESLALILPTMPVYDGVLRPGVVLGITTTAYSSTPDQTDGSPFITASGSMVHPGVVAATRMIPLGTKVKIDGVVYTVEDRMNARFGMRGRIDIWKHSVQEAREYGVQRKTVEIVSIPD